VNKIKLFKIKLATKKARKKFKHADSRKKFLDYEEIASLNFKYANFIPNYKYDLESLIKRGETRASQILHAINSDKEKKTILELGCGDGMTSLALFKKNNDAIATDISLKNLSPHIKKSGKNYKDFIEQKNQNTRPALYYGAMSASNTKFHDNTFDIIFSYNAFEHVEQPQKTFAEILRITKPGGFIYLSFAPLYYSPSGLHAYRLIHIPYVQFLFKKQAIEKFILSAGKDPKKIPTTNKHSIANYRDIWKNFENEIKVIEYKENFDTSFVDLIEKYPSCFKSKSQHFDNFIVLGIEAVFQKRK